jgi:hypothetical protein
MRSISFLLAAKLRPELGGARAPQVDEVINRFGDHVPADLRVA